MNRFQMVSIGLLFVGLFGCWLLWRRDIGALRAGMAALFRACWLVPILSTLFPQTTTETIPQNLQVKALHVLLDDSESMQKSTGFAASTQLIEDLKLRCEELGCSVKLDRLSEIDGRTKEGFTPLIDGLESWLFKLARDQWVVISDGGDWRPSMNYPAAIKGAARGNTPEDPRGYFLGVGSNEQSNVWIENVDLPPFSFDGRNFAAKVELGRSGESRVQDELRVQVQIQTDDRVLISTNALFLKNERRVVLELIVPPLKRGFEMLRIQALPIPDEVATWDNIVTREVEVLPNTIGALHLLGSPSWDGRFLRRYLKGEPKFDLISFFILRDRWDSQSVNERELSLIPFPVERLFNEELPNFRVVAIQNFALYEFLQPEYQQNLVNFVQGGGGLLFVGGPRALQDGDLFSSALGSILPFSVAQNNRGNAAGMNATMRLLGAYAPRGGEARTVAFNPEQKFKVKFSAPEESKRAIASVYDDWEKLERELVSAENLKGLHKIDRAQIKSNEATVLLQAQLPDGADSPLVVASYPGKGRALWVFSDSFWRLAFESGGIARKTYDRFFGSAMNWLLRQEFSQPILAREFLLYEDSDAAVRWRATVYGPAAKYFQLTSDWQLSICGEVQELGNVSVSRSGAGEWSLSGKIATQLKPGQRCLLSLKGNNAAFGSVQLRVPGSLPRSFRDEELPAALNRAESLGRHLVSGYAELGKEANSAFMGWLERSMGSAVRSTPPKTKVQRNFYWLFDSPWVWLFFLGIPAEVLVRRWHHLYGFRRMRKSDDSLTAQRNPI
jgi:hypothetical protein